MKDVARVKIEHTFKRLGTDIAIQLVTKDDAVKIENAKKILQEVSEKYAWYEKIFSRFDGQSELCLVNANLNKWQHVSVEFRQLAQLAVAAHKSTGGIFDPRIIEILENAGYREDFKKGNFGIVQENGVQIFSDINDDVRIKDDNIWLARRLDFSGIAKGYITDKVAEFLKKKDFQNFLLDSGGDIYAAGCDEQGYAWHISLEGFAQDLMFTLRDMAIATSGVSRRKWEVEGRRFHHLINPQKQTEFNFELKSVTVLAKNTENADVWAKTLFLMGKKAGMEYTKENKLAALFLDARGNVWISPEAKKLAA